MAAKGISQLLQQLPSKSKICAACIQRFLLARENQGTHLVQEVELDNQPSLDHETGGVDSDNLCKGDKTTFCSLCLGILYTEHIKIFADKISKYVMDQSYDSGTFSFNVAIPHLLHIRKHSFLMFLKDKSRLKEGSSIGQIAVKDALKENLVPLIEKETSKSFDVKGDFQVNVIFKHPNDSMEEQSILKTSIFQPISKRRKVEYSDVSWNKLEDSLRALSTADIMSRYYPCPPERSDDACEIASINTIHQSVYIGGRYNKLSRKLSQTPWIVDGERHGTTSVQELVCDPIRDALKAEDLKFLSSGREDVDVRMLGEGRPFAAEFINPRKVKLSKEDITCLETEINSKTEDIQVRGLQFVTKEDLRILKEGEEEKTKSYRALVYVLDPLRDGCLTNLAEIKNLVLKQKTPIRVLHRRALAVREKTIFEMSTEILDEHHFHLCLTTQAGTYIKEFVHGDFGRTVPSLETLIGQETDILELDVLGVDLPWPPKDST